MMGTAERRLEIGRTLDLARESGIRIKGKEIAARYNISIKTVEKDIQVLETLEYVVSKHGGFHGGYKLEEPAPTLDYLLMNREKAS
mgnify:CR=1 FL=1